MKSKGTEDTDCLTVRGRTENAITETESIFGKMEAIVILTSQAVREVQERLGFSTKFLSIVAGVNYKRLCGYMRDSPKREHRLSRSDFVNLADTVDNLQGLLRDVAPVPVDLRKVEVIKQLVKERRISRMGLNDPVPESSVTARQYGDGWRS